MTLSGVDPLLHSAASSCVGEGLVAAVVREAQSFVAETKLSQERGVQVLHADSMADEARCVQWVVELPEQMKYVIVNGTPLLKEGKFTGQRPG
ncbi:MAG TPA: hypothetical protein VMP01_00955 [Pirellulaceae bacterium]|nr:hypothetical protein [Pirellulaceae bacterium]